MIGLLRHAGRSALAVGMAATVLFGMAGAAQADTGVSNDPGKVKVAPLVANSSGRTAASHLATGGSARVTPMTTGSGGSIHASHSVAITPPGGRRGSLAQGFSSHYSSHTGVFTSYYQISSGSSYARWLGSSPYNASKISLTDRLWVGGVNISVSIGASPSAGVSISDKKVTMSSAVSRNWRNEHSFSNVKFSTHVAIWGPYENSADSATFGYKTFYDNIS